MLISKFFFTGSFLLIVLAACQGNGTLLRANAGQDFRAVVGTSPTFDGCASTGDIVNYSWTIVGTPDGKEAAEGKAIREQEVNCLFTLEAEMLPDEAGKWEIELEVRDANGNTDTDTVTVEVTQ